MNRMCARALVTAALAALAGGVVPACAHDDASIFIRHVMSPPASCVYLSDPAQPSLSQGHVDAALAQSYAAEVLIGNQLTSRASPENARAETARVNIQGAIVRVIDPADGSVQMENTVLTSATIDPSSGTTPTYGATSITMMNAAAIAHFDPKTSGAPSRLAVAYMKVFGQTLGGQSVESNEFQFPISVCHGCLVAIPVGARDSQYCTTPHPDVKAPCQLGADELTDCSLCQSNPACVVP